jgi:hypothetical protein
MVSPEKRRIHERYDVNWSVEVRTEHWGELQVLSTSNISRGGVFVLSNSPPEIGTTVHTTLVMPDGDRMRLQGVVMHRVSAEAAKERKTQPGFGVQFDAKHSLDLVLLEARAKRNAAGTDTYALNAKQFAIAASLLAEDGEQAAQIKPLGESPRFFEEKPEATELSGAEVAETEFSPAKTLRFGVPTLDTGSQAIFGIDLGSSYCRIGVVTERGVHVLADEHGRRSMPAIVACDEDRLIVGWEAYERLAHGAVGKGNCFPLAPKVLLGRRLSDPRVERYLRTTPLTPPANPSDRIVLPLGEERLSVIDVAAVVLRELLHVGQRASGLLSRRAVLAAPFGTSERQRAALLAAAHVAGIEVVDVLHEPVAAAIAHGLGKPEGALVGIYDLGGGGFNCSVLEIRGHRCTTAAEGGDPWLGGREFDLALANHAANYYLGDIRKNPFAWTQLLIRCEQVKVALSTSQSAILTSPKGTNEPFGPDLDISRALLADVSSSLVLRTLEVMDDCLIDASVEPEELDDIMIIGGMGQSPVVRTFVQHHYDRDLALSLLPDEAVVVGTALHGRAHELREQTRKG